MPAGTKINQKCSHTPDCKKENRLVECSWLIFNQQKSYVCTVDNFDTYSRSKAENNIDSIVD